MFFTPYHATSKTSAIKTSVLLQSHIVDIIMFQDDLNKGMLDFRIRFFGFTMHLDYSIF